MVDISIVVPAYNEQDRIGEMLDALLKEFSSEQVIVVSDGSTDSTADIVRSYKSIELIESEKTRGKGYAIVSGMRAAKGDILGFLDADGSFDPHDVKAMLSWLGKGHDCVIASKWMRTTFSKVSEGAFRKLSGRIWNFSVNALLGLGISDTQAGAKFMKRQVFEAIDCDFISCGFEFDVELLYLIKKSGYSIKEVQMPFTCVQDSTFRYSKTPSMMANLLRIALRD